MSKKVFEVVSFHSRRFGFIYVVDAEEVRSGALAVLVAKTPQFDPKRSDSLEQFQLKIAEDVVRSVAINLARRRKRDIIAGAMDVHDVDLPKLMGISDDIGLVENHEGALQFYVKRKPYWLDDVPVHRLRGRQHAWWGERLAAQHCAQRLAVLSTLLDWQPRKAVVPLLTYGFNVSTSAVAVERGVSVNAVQKLNSRFRKEVKDLAALEWAAFALPE